MRYHRDATAKGVAAKTLGALMALALLVSVGWLSYYRVTYHTFAWWEPPPRLHYCGRDFQEGSHSPTLPTGPWRYTTAFVIEPGGWKVYASKLSQAGIGPCTMGLIVRHNGHDYIAYGLLGGP
jgi:hypothetical protein